MGGSKTGLIVVVLLASWVSHARAELQSQGLQMQGLQMQGAELRGVRLREVRLRGAPVAGVRVVRGQLEGRLPDGRALAGTELTGATMVAETAEGRAVQLRIAAVEPDPTDERGETLLYDLQYRPLSGPARGYAPACRPDGGGDRRALPLQGVWDERGARHDSTDRFTFACTAGVLAKCARWGYRPWRSEGGRSLQDYHQACTRLARADYCGNGRAHTREGTVVNVYDDLGIQEQAPAPDMYFEAAWTPDGAYCVTKARLGLLPASVLLECPERLSLPSLGDLTGPDRCALRLSGRERSAALLSNRSFALLR